MEGIGLEIEFGTTGYMIMTVGAGAALLLLGVFIFRKFIRIVGIESWLILAALGPAGALLAMPIISMTNIPLTFSVPIAATAIIISVPIIHFVIPYIAPDFQTENFGMSIMLSVLIGLATMGSLHVNYELEGLIPQDVEGLSERETINFLE